MKNCPYLVGILAGLLLFGGCATGDRPRPAVPASPAATEEHDLRIRVEARPEGALVVFEGAVVGHAPLWLSVPATRLGFFREPTAVRVRFLADGPQGSSESVTAEFGVLDKVPAAIVFTRDGWTRVGR